MLALDWSGKWFHSNQSEKPKKFLTPHRRPQPPPPNAPSRSHARPASSACRGSSASPPSRAAHARASAPPAPHDTPQPPPPNAPSRSHARPAPERGAEVHLRHRPVERHTLARTLGEQDTIALNCLSQGVVVSPLVALTVKRLGLLVEIAQPDISAIRRHTASRLGKMPRRVSVAQLRHCQLTACCGPRVARSAVCEVREPHPPVFRVVPKAGRRGRTGQLQEQLLLLL